MELVKRGRSNRCVYHRCWTDWGSVACAALRWPPTDSPTASCRCSCDWRSRRILPAALRLLVAHDHCTNRCPDPATARSACVRALPKCLQAPVTSATNHTQPVYLPSAVAKFEPVVGPFEPVAPFAPVATFATFEPVGPFERVATWALASRRQWSFPLAETVQQALGSPLGYLQCCHTPEAIRLAAPFALAVPFALVDPFALRHKVNRNENRATTQNALVPTGRDICTPSEPVSG